MTTPDHPTFLDITYAKYGERELLLDVFLPTNSTKPFPTILLIPGGGWQRGPKESMSPDLVKKGFAVVRIAYRGSAEVTAPGCVFDSKAAVRWIRANASTYGFDPDHIGALGVSAGGHLVTLLGTSAGVKELEGEGGNPDFDSSVHAVCGLCGPSDLTRITLPQYKESFAVLYQVTQEYLGAPVEERLDLARLVSPLTHISKKTPPMLLIHGDADIVVPLDESIVLYDALKEAGIDVTLDILKGVDHAIPREDALHDQAASFFKRVFAK